MRRHSCLHAHYVIGQDQDNRRIGTLPNQGREPPLVWSVEFMKKVHVASNDTALLVFPLVACGFPCSEVNQLRAIPDWTDNDAAKCLPVVWTSIIAVTPIPSAMIVAMVVV